MRWLVRFLRSPDGFASDPRGFALNQIGHAVLVGAAPVWFGVPVWAVLAIFAAWEVLQWRRYGAEPWDGLEDWSFVAAGTLVVDQSQTVAAMALGGFLVSGVLRRRAALDG